MTVVRKEKSFGHIGVLVPEMRKEKSFGHIGEVLRATKVRKEKFRSHREVLCARNEKREVSVT